MIFGISGKACLFLYSANDQTGMFTWEIIQINGTATKLGKLAALKLQISLDGLPAGVYVLKILRAGEKYKSGLFVRQ